VIGFVDTIATMKVTLPISHIVTNEFTTALTALCRAKGLDVKQAWPLAVVKREAATAAKDFETLREDALAKHGLTLVGNGTIALTQSEGKTQADLLKAKAAFDVEIRNALKAPYTFGEKTPDAGSVVIEPGALSGDLLEQVMEFVKQP
jgi:hypothetical protein